MKKILIGIVVLVVLGVAYWLISPFWRNVELNEGIPATMSEKDKAEFERQTLEMKDKVMSKTEAMPSTETVTVGRAKLVAEAHDVKGDAVFIKSGNENYLRFENLKTINGPDLRIYIASSLDAKDFIDLGEIRATEGNVNYKIPAGTDLSKYKYAMIWCRAFGVLFSYAEVK